MVTTPIEASPKSKGRLLDISPASVLQVMSDGDNLTDADVRELRGLGLNDPILALYQCIEVSEEASSVSRDGRVLAWFGVQKERRGYGRIWMLTTNEAKRHPLAMARTAKHVIDTYEKHHTLLYNIMDPRNTHHAKFLKFLGFKRLGLVTVGPERRTYIEFAKLCAHQPSRQSSALVPPLLVR